MKNKCPLTEWDECMNQNWFFLRSCVFVNVFFIDFNCCSIFLMSVLLMVFVQVFSMFLETLVDFIAVHKEDLQDWLFVLLTQLLKKTGADLLGSVQAKVQKALDVTRYVIWKNWNPLFLPCSDTKCPQISVLENNLLISCVYLQRIFPEWSTVHYPNEIHSWPNTDTQLKGKCFFGDTLSSHTVWMSD